MTETIQRNSYFFRPTPPTHPPSLSRSSGMQPKMGTKVGHDVLADRSNNELEASVPGPHFTMNAPKKVRRGSINGTTRLERIVDWPQFRLRRKPTMPSGTKLPTPNIVAVLARQPVKAIHMNRLGTSEPSSVSVVTKQSHAASIPSSAFSFGAVHDDKPVNVLTPVRIATNPHFRRRYSAEEGFSDPKRPALRCEPPDYTSNNERLSSNSSATVRNSASKPSLSTTSTEQTDGNSQVLFQPSKDSTSRTKYRTGRYSAEAVLRSHKSYPALITQSPREKRRSSFFLEIRRSARDTLNSLRKALRGSTHSLQEAVELDHSVSVNLKERVEDDQGISRRSSLSCDKYSSQPIMDHVQTVLRNVTLSREDSSQPFGLYVVKSDQGFQITRLSEQVCTSPQKVLSCGDELVQVNGLDCKSLSTEAIRQLFHQCQSLSLTVKTVLK
ncbi:hypothetical protein CSKR_105260 [Clonorchis sinensis]|uniref:PDZ domain-containing protein n=1 Tax=Clonorchis sinensis TaxID=79923 RepID=A0A8T1MNK4_CLOSI|nr:hypothetical protein CSKR_105260 [Clonorchis sinensis]